MTTGVRSASINLMNEHYTQLVDSQIQLGLTRARDAAKLKHPGLRGRAREIFLRDLLRPFLNPTFDTCTGVVVDSQGGQSNQIDIIVYNKHLLPPILLTAEEGIIPCESTLATIEIKSKLTATELQQSIANARSVKALQPRFYEPNPTTNTKSSILCSVFAYGSTRKPQNESRTLQRYVKKANQNHNQEIHIPVSALCISDAVLTYCSWHDPEDPSNNKFEIVQKRALASYLSFLYDSITSQAAQRSPMYSAHYFQ